MILDPLSSVLVLGLRRAVVNEPEELVTFSQLYDVRVLSQHVALALDLLVVDKSPFCLLVVEGNGRSAPAVALCNGSGQHPNPRGGTT